MKKNLMSLVYILSLISILSPHAFASPDEIRKAQAEKKFLEHYKSTLPGYRGEQNPTMEDKLADQAYQKALKALKNERESLERKLTDLPNEILVQIAENLGQEDLKRLACTSWTLQGVAEYEKKRVEERAEKAFVTELDKHFVKIPEGLLPPGDDGTQVKIAAFEADQYPVTQKLWKDIMGSLPEGVQPNCPHCPITHVNWENEDGSSAEVQEFLKKLNLKVAKTGCTYDLPTDSQLHYMIRGDQTGTNPDLYSAGVTDANVNDYVTHWGNSGPEGQKQIQPVGQKTLNAFGIELGNVWKMSKDLYDPTYATWGRSVRGGTWDGGVNGARSDIRLGANAGFRNGSMGFSLVRTCH